jgi:hypothetical protein
MGWEVFHERIPEQVVPGKRLGRHIRHDSRSLAYLHQPEPGRAAVSQLWPRHIPILDQGDVGSCTGNAEVGADGTGPLFDALPAGHPALNEAEALRIYSAAETIDGDGPYPPNDNGSSGLSVAQAAKAAGLISGYTHCLAVTAMVSALQSGPVIIGINWYDSFDRPDKSSGLISVSPNAYVRGGHEVLVRGVDVTSQRFHADNSWGTSYGVNGSFQFSWATMSRLLAEQGDCTVLLPLSVPAPVPTPTPTPTPVPPGPGDPDVPYGHDARLIHWAAEPHVADNHYAAQQYTAWRQEHGYR